MSREHRYNHVARLEREFLLKKMQADINRMRYMSRGHMIGLGVNIMISQLTNVALTGLNPNMYLPGD